MNSSWPSSVSFRGFSEPEWRVWVFGLLNDELGFDPAVGPDDRALVGFGITGLAVHRFGFVPTTVGLGVIVAVAGLRVLLVNQIDAGASG
jgi:hypothetical protein